MKTYKLGDFHAGGMSEVRVNVFIEGGMVCPVGELCGYDGLGLAPLSDIGETIYGVASAYTEDKSRQGVVKSGLAVCIKTKMGEDDNVSIGDKVIVDPTLPSHVITKTSLDAGDVLVGHVDRVAGVVIGSDELGATSNALLVNLK